MGTVGSGVVRLLEDAPTSMRRREHVEFSIERVAVRDLSKERDVEIDPAKLTDDPTAVLDDPNVQLVVELTGAEPAYEWVRGAAGAGQGRGDGQQGPAGKTRRGTLRTGPGEGR